MANEAVLVFETSIPIPFTCADSGTIEKGTLLKLADPFTVSAAVARLDICGGIAAEEKITLDGKVKLPVYRSGIFKVVASGSITVGDPLVKSVLTTNLVETAAVNEEQIWGIALETATTGESLLMELKPMVSQLA